MKRSVLLEVQPQKYHVFPSSSISQDVNMATLGASKGIVMRYLMQKDGTRFRYIKGAQHLAATDMIARIYDVVPGHEEILPQITIGLDQLKRTLENDELEYRLYKTNLFEESFRVFLVAVDHKRLCAYDLQVIFPDLVPEDDLGLLITTEEDWNRVCQPETKVIEYLSSRRMCPMCKVVSNQDKPPRKPWHAKLG
jgi:hypothetical protein